MYQLNKIMGCVTACVLAFTTPVFSGDNNLSAAVTKIWQVGDGVGRESIEGLVIRQQGTQSALGVMRAAISPKRDLDLALVTMTTSGNPLRDELVVKNQGDSGLAIGAKLRWLSSLSDGGVVMVQRDERSTMTRVSETGKTLWAKTVGDLGFRVTGGSTIHEDTSLFVVGYTTYQPATRPTDQAGNPTAITFATDGVLAKVAADGQVLWRKTYDHANQKDYLTGVMPAPGGGLILIGYTSATRDKFGMGPSSVWLLECDEKGEVRNERVFPGRSPSACALGEMGIVISYDSQSLGIVETVLKSVTWKLEDRWEVPTKNTGLWTDEPLLVSVPGRDAVALVVQEKGQAGPTKGGAVLLVCNGAGKWVQRTEIPDSTGFEHAKLVCSVNSIFVSLVYASIGTASSKETSTARLYAVSLGDANTEAQR